MLIDEIHALKPLKPFSHDITVLDEFDPEAVSNAEVLIIDQPIPITFAELRSQLRKGCRVIAIMSEEAEANLIEEEFTALDDVWLAPVQIPRIRLRTGNILQEIKRDADAQLHLLWLETLMDSMPDLVWFKDLNGVHHMVNDKFCDFVKKDRDDVIGNKHSTIWNTQEDDQSCVASEMAAIETGNTILTDEIVISGGQKHLFKTYKTALKGLDGEVFGTVGFGHDLTNLLNLDMELNFFIESMPFPLAICNEADEIRKVNSRFTEFFEIERDAIAGKPFTQWQESKFQIETSPVNGEHYLRFMRDENKLFYVNMTRKSILDIFGKKVGSVNIYRDITAEKDLEIRIWRDANTDSLTGLANRHAFDAFISKLAPNSTIHLCYIDLDEFKSVNDRWGHKAGDDALRIVAKSIRNVFAQDFPARLGGDEFLVCVQRDVPLSELERLASRLLHRIQEKLGASEYLSKISASIGIRAGGSISETLDLLIRQADTAMYHAKTLGKARYCIWNETMDIDASH